MSAVNRCDYYQSACTLSARRSGLTDEEIIEVRCRDVGFYPRLAALSRVVRQVAANTGSVDETAWRAARDAGWSDEPFTRQAVQRRDATQGSL